MSQKLAIVFSSRHGHVERIARYIGDIAAARGLDSSVRDVNGLQRLKGGSYDAVVIVASVHFGHHERRLERFVIENARELAAAPTAFISVGSHGGP